MDNQTPVEIYRSDADSSASKKKRKKRVLLKLIIWLLIIAAVVALTLFLTAKIADFDSVKDMIDWIFAQIR